MTLQHQPSIGDFFDFGSKNSYGSLAMYKWAEYAKNRLYIVKDTGFLTSTFGIRRFVVFI